MAIIEYDHSPNISPEQRLRSLADSVRRAFEELESEEQMLEIKECKPVTLEELGGYPKTGGDIEGNVNIDGDISIMPDYAFEDLYSKLFGSTSKAINIFDIIFHIGYVIATTNTDFDPNKILPWQNWERFAKGKTLVGVDEEDSDFEGALLTGGEKTHMLTIAEIPSHNHAATMETTANKLGGGSTYSRFNDNGTPTSGIVNIGNTGGGEAHNNLQPYTTVYYWRRIASKQMVLGSGILGSAILA